MADDTTSVAAPAALRLPNIAWDLLGGLLRCPACQAEALVLETDGVSCQQCRRVYPVTAGVVDLVISESRETNPFYANPYYRTFIASLAQIHEAHYGAGGVGDKIESAIKQDLFKLVLPGSAPAIDLGCGLGECFPLMGDEANVIGVDFETGLLQEAHRRYPKASLIRADFAQLPFRTGSLQRAFSIAVLEHVFFIESAMAHLQRCLSDDGYFYVAVPTEGGLAVDVARLYTSSRNAGVIGLTPAQSRIAQRKDHCNTVFLIDNVLRKYFEVEAQTYWPFRLGGAHANLSKSYRLKTIRPQ